MQISNINHNLNLQTYNNVKKIVEEEHEQSSAPQTFYEECENLELPPFFVYDQYTKKSGYRKSYNWSSEKIMETVELALEEFSKLIDNNDVSVKNVNNMMSGFLPSDVSITFVDYDTEFLNYIQKKNHLNYEQAKSFMKTYKAYTGGDEKGNTLIFIPFGDVYKTDFERVMCKNYFAHELKHALTANLTDIEQNDMAKTGNLASTYCDIFKNLEQAFDFEFKSNAEKLCTTDLTEENFIKNIINIQTRQTYNCMEELVEDFENELIFVLNEYNLTRETLKSKAFCDYMMHYSTDEKEAYTFQKVLRELNANKPVKIELRMLKYEFFEKYFSDKSESLTL